MSLALGSAELIEDMHRRESEARFGSLVRNASDLITVVDSDGMIGYQSPSIERILGYHPDEVHGNPVPGAADRTAIAAGSASCSACSGAAARRDVHVRVHALPRRRTDDQFEVLATDLLDDEHVRGIVLNGRDVSERTAFEAQLAHQAFHDPVTEPAEPRALLRPRPARADARRPASARRSP